MNVTEFSPKQKQVIHWWDRPASSHYDGVIADGSIRSGKTVSMICGFLLWSQANFSRCNFILAGVTIGALVRNVVMPMKEIVQDWGWSYKENKSSGYLKIGSNYYWTFGGAGDGSQDKMQGLTAAGAYADEAALMSTVFLNQMIARCSVEGAKIWFNCNPENPQSLFKTDFIDQSERKNLLYLHFTMEDNPGLPKSTRERYERMYTGVFYDRYILGLWTQAEGIIYPMFNDALEEPYAGEYIDYCLSIDYGTQNAFVCQKWVRDREYVWHMIDEYRYSGRETGVQKTDQQYVQDICKFTNDYNGGQIVTIVDPSAASFIVALRKQTYDQNKVFKVMQANNDVKNGIMNTATALQMGYVMIGRNCKACIQEFGSYVWDSKSNEDKPIKEADHSMDALRYFVMTKRAYQEYVPYIPRF